MIPRYMPKDFAELWSDENRYGLWLRIELEVCRAMERQGAVPHGTTAAIKAVSFKPDVKRIEEIEKTTRHDVIAFLQHVEEAVGPPARWLHFGLTSSDVVDTAFSVTLSKAAHLIRIRTERLLKALCQKARLHAMTPMAGRSHGMHAELVTFGVAMAGHACEIARARLRLIQAMDEINVGKISGAVGTYAHFSPRIEEEALGSLDIVMRRETVSTQVVCRDRYAAFFCALGIMAASLERLATNIRHWSRSEVGEVGEAFGAGQKGSSAMPHKKNPISSENLCGLSRIVRSAVAPALEDVPLWNERDISHSSVERIIAPDATSVMAHMLDRAAALVGGLEVNKSAMMENIASQRGKYASEAVMLALIRSGMARKQAYEIVQRAAQDPEGFDHGALLAPEIKALGEDCVKECFSPKHALRHAEEVVVRALAEVEMA